MARRLCGEDNYPPPLLAVAGFGLSGSSRAFPLEPHPDEAWAALLSAARAHRVTGLLRAAVDQRALPATEAQAHHVRAVHRSIMLRVLSLERELIAVVDLLAASAIEARVLKGSAVAHLDYPQLALRSFVDLDILVRPEDIDRAVRVLVATGFVRRLAEPRPGFDRRFDKGTTLVSPAGVRTGSPSDVRARSLGSARGPRRSLERRGGVHHRRAHAPCPVPGEPVPARLLPRHVG